MPDLEQLREVTERLQPPPFAAIVEVEHRRRRRRRGAVAAVCVAVLAAGVATVRLGDVGPDDVQRPVDSTRLTPEEIRSDPRSYGTFEVEGPEPGVAVRAWLLCTAHCAEWLRIRESNRMYDQRYAMEGALELTTDGFRTSVLLADPVDDPIQFFGFSENAFLLHRMTSDGDTSVPDDPPRFGTYELVHTDGIIRPLDELEFQEPSPGSTLVSGFWGLMAVDPQQQTIAPVSTATLPIGKESVNLTSGLEWAPFLTWPWGLYGISYGPQGVNQRFWAAWEQPDGSFTSRLLADGPLTVYPQVVRKDGVMAFVETAAITSTTAVAVHLSTDRGRTWQRSEVTSNRHVDELLRPYR